MDTLISSLHAHALRFPEEQKYADQMIAFLTKNQEKSFHNYLWEDGHITGSMLIVNIDFTKVLLMFHKKLQRWLQFGGHSDDSPDVLATAIREFHEESGIVEEPEIFVYHESDTIPIFAIDIHEIPADAKWRPEHRHYDVRFLGIISDTVSLDRQIAEVDDIRWFDIEWIEKYIEEENLLRMIEKIKNMSDFISTSEQNPQSLRDSSFHKGA